MKRVALLLLCAYILTHQGIAQSGDDIVSIPDTAFLYALIEEGVDTNEDSLISFNEAESVTNLWVMNYGISDMTGIEAFVMLDSLVTYANNIERLNLSTLSGLTFLAPGMNPIDSLDLSNNPALLELYTDDCNLTYLDLSNNHLLRIFSCERNQLSSLDVSANVNLEVFWCNHNPLGSLDLSKNAKLEFLMCDSIQTDTLDVSENTSLEILYCRWNNLTSLILPDSSALLELDCGINFLESIDVSGCPNLLVFAPYDNNITSLDVSNNPQLEYLSCEQNQLSSLDVTNNLDLTLLWCGENQLTSLDLSQNSKIGTKDWRWEHLNLENMPSLKEVCVWDSFPGDAEINIDGSPNICWDSIACNGVCNPGTGIDGFDHSELMIYPNPTSDLLTIETASSGPHSIQLLSSNGQELYSATFTGTLHEIDLSFYRKGIYFLRIRSDNITATRKVIKL